MAEMPDRHKVNLETSRIVSRYRDEAGHIPALNVALLLRDLNAHVDATIRDALDYGVEIGKGVTETEVNGRG